MNPCTATMMDLPLDAASGKEVGKELKASKNVAVNPSFEMMPGPMPEQVLAALDDKARLCPMLSGACCITREKQGGGCLLARTGEEQIEVTAPYGLLRKVFTVCDGSLSITEILDQIDDPEKRAEFSGLLDFLLGQGVLIDASLACIHAAQLALHSSPVGLTANSRITNLICRRSLAAVANKTPAIADESATGKSPVVPEKPVAGTTLVVFEESMDGKTPIACEEPVVPASPTSNRSSHRVRDRALTSMFDKRISSTVFGNGQPSMVALHGLLWSMAGIVKMEHPRMPGILPLHTFASAGGMQLLEIYLVLQVRIGDHEPGVYRVLYPDAAIVSLQRLDLPATDESLKGASVARGADADLEASCAQREFWRRDLSARLARTFSRPWEMACASGAIFIAADAGIGALRYRNRSLQYLFMETGAALQNASLSAAKLGVAFCTIGNFHEYGAADLCRLDKQLVLGSAIFGAPGTKQQQLKAARSAQFDFSWINAVSPKLTLEFHMARAQIKAAGEDRPYAWGRDCNPWLAMRKALAEAVEREGFREPRHIETGSMAEIKDALDPRHFVSYRTSQYANDFGYQRFDSLHRYCWTSAIDLVTGRPVKVLAELVFSKNSLRDAGFSVSRPYTQTSSSGCAAGIGQDDARWCGLLEIIERDAFMRHWLAQSPGSITAPALLPDPIGMRLRRLEAAGCKVSVQQLSSQWAHVVMVAAQHEQHHFTTMGTAAHGSYVDALESALAETEARVYSWLHGYRVSITCPEKVNSTEDHFALYGLKRYFRRADNVLFPNAAPTLSRLPRTMDSGSLRKLVGRFAREGLHPLAVDITPRQNQIEQGRTTLSVARVLVPGLLPMSFGFGREPLGMVKKVATGAKFPHPFP